MWGGQKIQKAQGFATLLFTMVVLASITAFAFISAQAVVTNQRSVVTFHNEQSAFNIAQAGLDYAIPYLTANYATIANGSSQRIDIPGGGYATLSFAFVGDKNTIRVSSTGVTADGATTSSMQQLVKYQTSAFSKTYTQPILARSGLTLSGNTTAIGNSTNFVTARLGSNSANITQTAATVISNVRISSAGSIGADIVSDPSIFTGKTNAQLQTEMLGQTISDYAAKAAITTVNNASGIQVMHIGTAPGRSVPVRYFVQSGLNPYTGSNSMRITSNIDVDIGYGGSQNRVTLGTVQQPVTLVINLTPNPDPSIKPIAKILSTSIIYGDIIVRGGNLEIDTAAMINGRVIVENGYVKITQYNGYNAVLNGNVIGTLMASGNVDLVNGSVKGVVYSDGNINLTSPVTSPRSYIQGAAYSGGTVSANNSSIAYSSSLGKITLSNSASNGAYGKVAGSWSDI